MHAALEVWLSQPTDFHLQLENSFPPEQAQSCAVAVLHRSSFACVIPRPPVENDEVLYKAEITRLHGIG